MIAPPPELHSGILYTTAEDLGEDTEKYRTQHFNELVQQCRQVPPVIMKQVA